MILGHQWIKKKILGCLHSRSFRERDASVQSLFTNEQEPDWFGGNPPECKGPRIAPEPLTAAGVHPASDRNFAFLSPISAVVARYPWPDFAARADRHPETARRMLFSGGPRSPLRGN